MELDEIKEKIKNAIISFYKSDIFLIQKGLCERCLLHKLAVYLEKEGFEGYFIDCEYNKSHLNGLTSSKVVSNPNGNYIDIIIGKRNGRAGDDLVCFEVKRPKKYNGRKKDRENLKILTKGERFDYDFGFYILFGECLEKTNIEIYFRGELNEKMRFNSLKL